MLLKMFTVYDSKVQAYTPPVFLQSAGAAIRTFENSANDPQSNINKYPEDFTLFETGTFDDQTGFVTPYAAHICLMKAIEVQKR